MRTSIILLICFISFGCKPDLEDLKGHWHSCEKDGIFEIWDINDSLVTLSENTSIGQIYQYPVHLIDENGEIMLPFFEDIYPEFTSDFYMFSNILYLKKTNEIYIKRDKNRCWREDLFFKDLMIEVNLKECEENTVTRDSIQEKYSLALVSIGKPKQDFGGQTSLFDTIQVNDVLIEPWELQMFAMQEHERHSEFKQGILLNIDKNASLILLDSIYWNLSQVLTLRYVFETCIDEENKEVRYQRSKRFQEFRMRL